MSLYYDDNEIRIFQQQQQQHHPTSEPSCVSTNKKKPHIPEKNSLKFGTKMDPNRQSK